MTVDYPQRVACPACDFADTVKMGDAVRFCPACRHEWDPTAPPALRAVPDAPATSDDTAAEPPPTSDDTPPAPNATDDTAGVLGPPESERRAVEAQRQLDALIGRRVELDGGQHAVIVAFPDDDHVTVLPDNMTEDEDQQTVDFNDVVRVLPAEAPVADLDDNTAKAIAEVNMTIAALTLKAGCATVAGEYPRAEIVTPPAGWMPLDPEALPALEQGVAYAVAILIHAYRLDREWVEQYAETLLANAGSTTETKGDQE